MMKAMEAYRDAGFDGVMSESSAALRAPPSINLTTRSSDVGLLPPTVPDHTPSTSSPAPWHAGIAFAIGFMKASAKAAGIEFEKAEGDGEYSTAPRL